jgi:hypothetical protein
MEESLVTRCGVVSDGQFGVMGGCGPRDFVIRLRHLFRLIDPIENGNFSIQKRNFFSGSFELIWRDLLVNAELLWSALGCSEGVPTE